MTLEVADPKEVLASLRSVDVATTLRLPVLADDEDVTIRGRRDASAAPSATGATLDAPSAPQLPHIERTALDAALEAAARAATLEELEELDDDSPTIRGTRPKLELEAFPDELPTLPVAMVPAAAMVREALLAATKVALADGEPAPFTFEEDDEDRTLRADRRALTIAMQGDRSVPEASTLSKSSPATASKPRLSSPATASTKPRLIPIPTPAQPPALPVPLVRRVDAWIDELPEAARRVLLDAREAQPSWPLVERTEGAVLRPKQRIPSLRPRSS